MSAFNIPDWDTYYMSMAYLCATRSKDPDTHVGAVIVGPDNEVRSTGYNGLPRDMDDDKPERFARPEKYLWFEHAERNAIYNAARVGIPLFGCRIYVCGLPCCDCSRAIVQSGISVVVTDHDWDEADNRPEWKVSIGKSLAMLREAGVSVKHWQGDIVKVVRLQRGVNLRDT
jgi:dCMP deaminase